MTANRLLTIVVIALCHVTAHAQTKALLNVRLTGPGRPSGASGSNDSVGTGIDAETTLNDCWIVVHARDIGTALDLNDNGTSRLGTGCFISVTTDSGTVATPIDLPPRWDDRTNQIWIDGVRQTSR